MIENKTFADDIEEAAGGEPIEAIVIANYPWRPHVIPENQTNTVLSWEEARPLLDYLYDRGFGLSDCNAIYAWTPTRVLFVHEYDGATGVHWLPRSPFACVPNEDGEA